MNEASFSVPVQVPSRHPSLAGHFPGNPVVPGVVLLDHLAAALEQAGAGRLQRIRAVKFLTPLLPEELAAMTVISDGTRVRFRIDRAGTPILAGEAELAPIGEPGLQPQSGAAHAGQRTP